MKVQMRSNLLPINIQDEHVCSISLQSPGRNLHWQ